MKSANDKATCNGDNPDCPIKWYYESCDFCPYICKPTVIVKVAVPKNSTIAKKRVAGGKNC